MAASRTKVATNDDVNRAASELASTLGTGHQSNEDSGGEASTSNSGSSGTSGSGSSGSDSSGAGSASSANGKSGSTTSGTGAPDEKVPPAEKPVTEFTNKKVILFGQAYDWCASASESLVKAGATHVSPVYYYFANLDLREYDLAIINQNITGLDDMFQLGLYGNASKQTDVVISDATCSVWELGHGSSG